MPKTLKIHPNERVDLDDFERAANTYTAEGDAFFVERMLLAKRARLVEGFRIEVSDQTTNPGEITIYNGHGYDSSGYPVHNEDQANDSRTVTLTGASQTFYVEIEFHSELADPDARAFWDPVYDNASPDPDGREFDATVPTRSAPNWRVVTPVSTSGFEVVSTPTSRKIPLAVLKTNVSNAINNPGLVYVTAASVLEEDVALGASAIRALNSRLLPDTGGSIIVGAGGSTPQTVTVSTNDFATGVVTFAPVLTNDHLAGAIVRVAGTARFLQENTEPVDVAVSTSATQPDAQRRFFQGDEIRGSAIAASKEVVDGRGDLNIENFKDYVDFVAAHFHDLRFGTLRSGELLTDVPTAFDEDQRYFASAGGVMGARSATFTIGDGVNSWGDFNGDTEAPFIAAVAAMPTNGGVIFVKRGTYTFSNVVTVTKNILFVGEGKRAVALEKGAATYLFDFNPGGTLKSGGLENMYLSTNGAAATTLLLNVTGSPRFKLNDLHALGCVVVDTASVTATNSSFVNFSGSDPTFSAVTLSSSHFKGCSFASVTAEAVEVTSSVTDTTFDTCSFIGTTCLELNASIVSQLAIQNCTFDSSVRFLNATGTVTALTVGHSRISTASAATNGAYLSGTLTGVLIHNCKFSGSWASAGTVNAPKAFISVDSAGVTGFTVQNCTFTGTNGTSYVTAVMVDNVSSTEHALRITGCTFQQCYGLFHTGSAEPVPVIVSDCQQVGSVYNRVNYGIYSDAPIDLAVSNSAFNTLRDDNTAVSAIHVDDASGFASTLTMTGCYIDGVRQTAGALASGVYWRTDSSQSIVNISNTTIRAVLGATGAHGIYFNPAGTSQEARVANCHINTITATVSGVAVGIYGLLCTKSTFVSNRVHAITGVSASRCVWLTDATDVVIGTNVMEDQVYLEGTMTRVSVTDNTMDVNAALTTGCIRVYYSDGSDSINLVGNIIQAPDFSGYGIEVAGTSSAAVLRSLKVAENNITLGSVGGTGIFYATGESRGMQIVNNIVREPTTALGTRAIYVSSSAANGHRNAHIEGNSAYFATKTGNKTGAAISVVNAQNMVLANNSIDVGTGSFTGVCISVDSSIGVILGNVCTGTNSGTSSITVVNIASDVMVAGNRCEAGAGGISLGGTVYSIGVNEGAVANYGAYGYNLA